MAERRRRDLRATLLMSLVVSLPIALVIVLLSDRFIGPGLARDILQAVATQMAELATALLLQRTPPPPSSYSDEG